MTHCTDEGIVWEYDECCRSETKGLEVPFTPDVTRAKRASTGPIEDLCPVSNSDSVHIPTESKGITWAEVCDSWTLWVTRSTPRHLKFSGRSTSDHCWLSQSPFFAIRTHVHRWVVAATPTSRSPLVSCAQPRWLVGCHARFESA